MDAQSTASGPYQYRWSKRDDARHTISNLATLDGIQGFIRQNRAGVPWRILDQPTGKTVAAGVGPDVPLALR